MSGTPAPAAPAFYVTGGTLRRDAASYIRRQADLDLYDGLTQGHFCYVLTSRQMGKSSLMVRTAARLREEGVAVAALDLTAIGQNVTVEQWYDGLLGRLGEQLGLEQEIDQFWISHERLGPLQRWMAVLRDVVLVRCAGRVVIFVDEIDATRSLPFSTDEFFAGIRECYNRRADDAAFARLTFCLLGVATPSDLIRDPHTTPFNIGRRIELTDFTESEARPLAQGLQRDADVGAILLKRILHWTAGHPYLTQRLCQAVADDAGVARADGVDRVCEDLFLSPRARERDDNLLFVRERILRTQSDVARVLDLYRKVQRWACVPDDETNPVVGVLRLSGVTRAVDGQLRVRNHVYERVFDRRWVIASMPDAELRRQRAAYRRGVLRTGAVAAVVVVLVAALAFVARDQQFLTEQLFGLLKERYERVQKDLKFMSTLRARDERQRQMAEAEAAYANLQRQQAETQRKAAEAARGRADYQAYVATLAAADSDLEAGDSAKALRRLMSVSRDFQRNWEWRYLHSRTDSSIATLMAPEDSAQLFPQRAHLAVSPDGGRVFLATAHSVLSWDIEKQTRTTVFSGDRLILAMSADAGTIVTGVETRDAPDLRRADRQEPLEVVELATGRVMATLKAPQTEAVGLDATGSRIATKMMDRVTVWSARTGETIADAPYRGAFSESIVISPDGLKVLMGDTVWQLDSGKNTKLKDLGGFDLIARPGPVFSPDGSRVAMMAGGRGQNLTLLATGSGAVVRVLAENEMFARSQAFSPDGRILARGEFGGDVKLWDVESGGLVANLAISGTAQPNAIAFSSDGRRLFAAYGPASPHVRVWDMNRVELARGVPDAFSTPILSMATRVDPKVEAAVRELQRLPDLSWPVPALIKARAVSADGRHVAYAVAGHVGVWELDTQALERQARIDEVDRITISADATRILAGTSEGELFWTELDERSPRLLARGMTGAVAISDDGKLAASSDTNGVTVWELATHPKVMTFAIADPVRRITLDPGTRRLITWAAAPGTTTSSVRAWNLDTGRLLWEARRQEVDAVAVSPDGRLIAIGRSGRSLEPGVLRSGQSAELEVLSAATGLAIVTMRPLRSQELRPIAFSSDGRRIALGTDSKLHIWDTTSGVELLTLRSQPGYLRSITFSRDGKRLVVTAYYGVRVYDADSPYCPGARDLVETLYEELFFSEDVQAKVRSMTGIDVELRRAALELTVARGDSPEALRSRSQAIAERADQLPAHYRVARRMAERAVRLDPRSSACLLALGMAQYRMGEYEAALESLRRADRVGASLVDTRGFVLSMTYARLGKLEQGRVEFEQVRKRLAGRREAMARAGRETLSPPPGFGPSAELEREAEALVMGSRVR